MDQLLQDIPPHPPALIEVHARERRKLVAWHAIQSKRCSTTRELEAVTLRCDLHWMLRQLARQLLQLLRGYGERSGLIYFSGDAQADRNVKVSAAHAYAVVIDIDQDVRQHRQCRTRRYARRDSCEPALKVFPGDLEFHDS